MRITITISTIIMLFALNCAAQTDKKQIREGNKLYSNKKFRESEVSYQKALKKDPKSFKAGFNLGDALYKQEKFDEASKQFTEVSAKSNDKTNSSKAFHNLGNSYLLQNKFDESINAYKNALRNNPTDLATKYNLAYAQAMKKKQKSHHQVMVIPSRLLIHKDLKGLDRHEPIMLYISERSVIYRPLLLDMDNVRSESISEDVYEVSA